MVDGGCRVLWQAQKIGEKDEEYRANTVVGEAFAEFIQDDEAHNLGIFSLAITGSERLFVCSVSWRQRFLGVDLLRVSKDRLFLPRRRR